MVGWLGAVAMAGREDVWISLWDYREVEGWPIFNIGCTGLADAAETGITCPRSGPKTGRRGWPAAGCLPCMLAYYSGYRPL